MEKAAHGVLLELQDGAFPLVTSMYSVLLLSSPIRASSSVLVHVIDIVATSDYKVAFDNVDCMLPVLLPLCFLMQLDALNANETWIWLGFLIDALLIGAKPRG